MKTVKTKGATDKAKQEASKVAADLNSQAKGLVDSAGKRALESFGINKEAIYKSLAKKSLSAEGNYDPTDKEIRDRISIFEDPDMKEAKKQMDEYFDNKLSEIGGQYTEIQDNVKEIVSSTATIPAIIAIPGGGSAAAKAVLGTIKMNVKTANSTFGKIVSGIGSIGLSIPSPIVTLGKSLKTAADIVSKV